MVANILLLYVMPEGIYYNHELLSSGILRHLPESYSVTTKINNRFSTHLMEELLRMNINIQQTVVNSVPVLSTFFVHLNLVRQSL